MMETAVVLWTIWTALTIGKVEAVPGEQFNSLETCNTYRIALHERNVASGFLKKAESNNIGIERVCLPAGQRP
jgi:hypothetical protein